MKNILYGIILTLIITACSNENADEASVNTSEDAQQNNNITWASKFPSLWGAAYAADISPEDVTYEQFLQAVTDKLKVDTDFKSDVKGVTGEQGPVGPAGPQGVQGMAGQDGSDAVLPSWETVYTFGAGDNFFYTCNSSTPCIADDITFHQISISTTESYYKATLTAGPITGTNLLKTNETISNIDAGSDCKYKAEILGPTFSIESILLPYEIRNGGITFIFQGAFSSQFNILIGDASTPLLPRIYISKILPESFSGNQFEKDRVAYEFTDIGTNLSYQIVLKRRCH